MHLGRVYPFQNDIRLYCPRWIEYPNFWPAQFKWQNPESNILWGGPKATQITNTKGWIPFVDVDRVTSTFFYRGDLQPGSTDRLEIEVGFRLSGLMDMETIARLYVNGVIQHAPSWHDMGDPVCSPVDLDVISGTGPTDLTIITLFPLIFARRWVDV